MNKTNSRTVSTRLKLVELAKARDGLLARGIEKNNLQTTSQILRLAIYFAILNCEDPKSAPSQESIDFVKQLWNQSKMTKKITLDEFTE